MSHRHTVVSWHDTATCVALIFRTDAHDTCRAFVVLLADLRPLRRYRISTAASAALVSTDFFGPQPLSTREPGSPDSFTFTVDQPRATFDEVFLGLIDDAILRILVEPAVRPACALACRQLVHTAFVAVAT